MKRSGRGRAQFVWWTSQKQSHLKLQSRNKKRSQSGDDVWRREGRRERRKCLRKRGQKEMLPYQLKKGGKRRRYQNGDRRWRRGEGTKKRDQKPRHR